MSSHATPSCITATQLQRDCSLRDLSDPREGPHALQLLVDRAVDQLASTWGCAVRRYRAPRVVTIADNYDNLGYGPDSISRESRYTRYVDGEHLLRSHSSAMIPAALRQLAGENLPEDDVLIVCPGIVYRRDSIDWQHTGTPHQLDLWRVTRRPVTEGDLDEMITLLLAGLVPGLPHEETPRSHPYTTGGRQVDVLSDGRLVEVWECGLAHPDVLTRAGLGGRHGLALGMGLDRMCMLVKGIPDIRLLRSTDPRVARQMLDLLPYRPASAQPAIRRDLSVAVASVEDEETLGGRVRDALGGDASCVEEVAVLATTAYEDLPEGAIRRLGARPGQKNVLVRVVLRDLDTTLTDERANALRDRIYDALHEGEAHEWASAHEWATGRDRPAGST